MYDPEYDKPVAEKRYNISDYVYKVIRKNRNVFFQGNVLFFVFPQFLRKK